jgi:hypothetical protein
MIKAHINPEYANNQILAGFINPIGMLRMKKISADAKGI